MNGLTTDINNLASKVKSLKDINKASAKTEILPLKARLAELQEQLDKRDDNKDPRHLEADVKRAVNDAELSRSTSFAKLQYAIDSLKSYGRDTSNAGDPDSLIRQSIELQVIDLTIGLCEIKHNLKCMAESSAEFRAKYSKKRFNAANGGESHILTYIYWGYLRDEGWTNPNDFYARPLYGKLYTLEEVGKHPRSVAENMSKFMALSELEDWLSSTSDTMNYTIGATRRAIAHIFSIAKTAMTGQYIAEGLGETAEEKGVAQILSNITVDGLKADSTTGLNNEMCSIRHEIALGLRRIAIYNASIEAIGNALKIPEIEIFQFPTDGIKASIETTNFMLAAVREKATDACKGMEINSSLGAMIDIPTEAWPIPQESIESAEREIKYNILRGFSSWGKVSMVISGDGYDRRSPIL